jgi:hypothetical protein
VIARVRCPLCAKFVITRTWKEHAEFEVSGGDSGSLTPSDVRVPAAGLEGQRGSRPTVDAAVRDDSCATTQVRSREIPTYSGERT